MVRDNIVKLLEIVMIPEFDELFDDEWKLALLLRQKGLELTPETKELLADIRFIYYRIRECLDLNMDVTEIVYQELKKRKENGEVI